LRLLCTPWFVVHCLKRTCLRGSVHCGTTAVLSHAMLCRHFRSASAVWRALTRRDLAVVVDQAGRAGGRCRCWFRVLRSCIGLRHCGRGCCCRLPVTCRFRAQQEASTTGARCQQPSQPWQAVQEPHVLHAAQRPEHNCGWQPAGIAYARHTRIGRRTGVAVKYVPECSAERIVETVSWNEGT
jgi:hypothetical protein